MSALPASYTPQRPPLGIFRPATPETCQHCHTGKVNRPRGLCWTCYYTPGVRSRYPSTNKFARRGVGNGNHAPPLPAGPTAALPGSAAKVRVLEERASLGQSLWHPLDAISDVRHPEEE